MKPTIILLTLSPGALANGFQLHPRSVCYADDCARAVTGTVFGPEGIKTHEMDCSSFFSVTVIPVAVATTTLTPTDPPACLATYNPPLTTPKTITPTAVPTYASSCSGTSHYSSACSCWGFTLSTTTALPATITSTVCESAPVANSGEAAPSRTWTLLDFSAGGARAVASNCLAATSVPLGRA
ncbi:hypothetical protein MMC30_007212 [Trapelia coarctata]|nr:hypothetical protein [Trapelia coarctata]